MNDRGMQIVGDEHRYVTKDEAARAIVAAVLALNALDAQAIGMHRRDALKWLDSWACAHWCEQLGVNPHYYAQRVRQMATDAECAPDRRQDYMNARQAADTLDVTVGRVRQLVDAGRLRAEKIGRYWLVQSGDVAEYQLSRRPDRARKLDEDTL